MSKPHRPFKIGKGMPAHPDRFSDILRGRVSALRDKVGYNVSINFSYLTHVWGFIEVAPAQIFPHESGFGHSRECIQSVAACG